MAATAELSAPPLVSSRRDADTMLEALPVDLSSARVTVDLAALELTTPSFVDQMVSGILVHRNAALLLLRGGSDDIQRLAVRSARRRGVEERLTFEPS